MERFNKMEGLDYMNLEVKILDGCLDVVCSFRIRTDEIFFSLAHSFSVISVTDGGEPVFFESVPCDPVPFRPQKNGYALRNLKSGDIVIRYRGTVEWYFGYLRDDLIHFSYYNCWYPEEFMFEDGAEVSIHIDDTWTVVGGVYDSERKLWRYHTPKNQRIKDCNVLALNRVFYSSVDSDVLTVFCKKGKEDICREYISIYRSVCDFYVSLYGKNKVEKTNLVFIDVPDRHGAYFRRGLIVNSNPPGLVSGERHGLAHEIGHAYGGGADTNSWEDWLNETTAEWSALLYEEEHDPESFENALNECREWHGNGPLRLREAGDARPDNVHETGTLIYEKIYQQYGKDAVKSLLVIFDSLEVKNTQSFLDAIRSSGKEVLADIICSFMN